MIKVEVTRNLIGLQDLLLGVGSANQTRGGTVVSMTKINGANFPYDETFTMQEKFDDLQEQIDNLPEVVDEFGNLLTGLINTSNLDLDLAGRLWRKTISGTVAELYYGTELLFQYNPTTGGLIFPDFTDDIADAIADVTADYIAADAVITASLGTAAAEDVGTSAGNVVQLDGTGKLPAVDGSQLTGLPGGLPIGTILMAPYSAPDTNFMECAGAAIDRTTYATLFAKIGTTYGPGDGSTTFNLPDLRGEFIRGWDNSRGIDIGRAIGSIQAEETKAHVHAAGSIVTNNAGTHTHTLYKASGGSGAFTKASDGTTTDPPNPFQTQGAGDHSHTTSGNSASTGGVETRPRNIALMYQIKVL